MDTALTKMSVYKRCQLLSPNEGEHFSEVVSVICHGEPDDPRSLVYIKLGKRETIRNIWDVMFLDAKGNRVDNPWFCPGTTLSEVCRVLGIDKWKNYSDAFLSVLAEDGYEEKPRKLAVTMEEWATRQR